MSGNRFTPYDFTGKPLGVTPDTSYAIKDAYINQDFQTVCDAIGVRYIRGGNCADKNSTSTSCEIWLQADGGSRKVADENAHVLVYYSTHVWSTTVKHASGECYIVFTDADCQYPATPSIADYSSPSFIAALRIYVFPSTVLPRLPKSCLVFDGSAQGGISSNDIPRSTGAPVSGSIEEAIADVETTVAAVIDPVTGLIDGAVSSVDQIEEKTFLNEADANLIWGDLGVDSDLDGLSDRWQKIGNPTPSIDTTNFRIGQSSQKLVIGFAGEGIRATPNTYEPRDFAGEWVSFTAYVYVHAGGAADSVYLEITDGVTSSVSSAGGAVGSWVRLGVSHEVSPSVVPGGLEFRILGNQAVTISVDGAKISRGKLFRGYSPNVLQLSRAMMRLEDQVNWIPNSQFDDWTNGTSSLPDFWRTGLSGIGTPTSVAQVTSAGNVLFGTSSCQLGLQNGEGIYLELLNPQDFRSYGLIASAYVKLVSTSPSSDPLWLMLDDGVTSFYSEFTPTTSWQRPTVGITVDPSATYLRLAICNRSGSASRTDVYVDGVMLTKNGGGGGFNVAYRPSVAYKPYIWEFVLPGTVTPGIMYHHGAKLDVFPIPSACFLHKIRVWSNTAPGPGVFDTYTVTLNGTGTSLAALVAGSSQAAAVHLPATVAASAGQLIQVTMSTSGGTSAANVGVSVEGIRIGY